MTSYDAASAGSVVNEVKYTYDGWGNVVKSEQNAAGAVGAGTPAVQYAFADGASAGEAQYVRQQYLTYADGRQLEYVYPVGGGFDGHTLSRWYAIKDVTAGNVTVASYSWLGSSQLAYRSERTAVSGGLTLDYGDDLSGWDRFGRVIDQKWTNTAGTTDVDRTKYTYDRNSNRLTRDVQSTGGTTGHDEAYTYDGLDRLSGFDRGTLTTGTMGSVNFSQGWDALDSEAALMTTSPAEPNVLDTIPSEGKRFDEAIGKFDVRDFPSLMAKGTLLLLADRGKEAEECFETAVDLASSDKELSAAVERTARAMRAADRGVGRANTYVLGAQQPAVPAK